MFRPRTAGHDPLTRRVAVVAPSGNAQPREDIMATSTDPDRRSHQGGSHRRPDRPALVRRARQRQRRQDGHRRHQRQGRPARPAPRAAPRGRRDRRRGRGRRRPTKLVEHDRVDVIFGGIYSSTRQAIKGPAVVEGKTLYIYPEQYEGQESDPLIFCTGPVPAQQVDPFIPWLMRETGAKTFYLPSADYIWPHVLNERVREVVTANGGTIVGEEYFPLDHTDYRGDGRADHRERRGRRVQHDRAARRRRRSSSSCTTPASRAAAGSSSARTSTRTS